MDASDKPEVTPRRSARLHRQHAVTPDTKPLGPRELMLLNKSRQKNAADSSITNKKENPVEINIIPPTPVQEKPRKRKMSSVIAEKPEKQSKSEPSTEIVVDPKEEESRKESVDVLETKQKKQTEKVEVQQVEKIETQANKTENQALIQKPNESDEFHSAINENVEDKIAQDDTIKQEQTDEKTVPSTSKNQPNTDENDLNKTPQLMDESIISVPESPPMTKSTVVKDTTFSPEVDTSITDARPHIDKIFNVTPIYPQKSIAVRTSTPLSQRIFSRNTPKLSEPLKNAISKILSPKIDEKKKLNEEGLNETFNGQFKMINPLEKSILKSSRRKRSLSVADGDSFMQKKVMFMSPEIMNIDTIDEKMLQSFRDEKENSILKHPITGGSGIHRKRSLSETGQKKIKVPNFRAIHEKQFEKMESIEDNKHRIAQRAKMLVTPSKVLPSVPENEKKGDVGSKIPTRKILGKVSSTQNITQAVKPRQKKRSNSVDTPSKSSSNVPKFKVNIAKEVTGLPRILGENSKVAQKSKIPAFNSNVKSLPSTSKPIAPKPTASSSSLMRSKVEERREKNMSMYKGNAVKSGLDYRKKNENVLKGVRLNRRFELQMQHRRMEETDD